MKATRILRAFGNIKDKYIEEAAGGGKKRRGLWLGAVAAALAAAILLGAVFSPRLASSAYAVAEPELPEMARYPSVYSSSRHEKWRVSRDAQRRTDECLEGLDSFYSAVMEEFLTDAGTGNLVCSPLNVYIALAMLAETTAGETRAQILELLGVNDLETLRAKVSDLWNWSYCDDGAITSVPANSLWLNKSVRYSKSTLNTLADSYYASSFSGEMGSEGYDKALQSWINEQTRGLLETQASKIELDHMYVLALVSTVYFKAAWASEYNAKNTDRSVFHTPAGDAECDFMRRSSAGVYCWGEKFGAISKPFRTGGFMRLILPDEGVSVDELLRDPEVLELIFSGHAWENSKSLIIHESVPKFDVSSDIDLAEGLKSLGVTDVFSRGAADFSPLTTDVEEIWVDKVEHAARVKIDEEGVEAAAFTVAIAPGAGMPPDGEVDFVLDRPFIFAISGLCDAPLFIGVVNNPAG